MNEDIVTVSGEDDGLGPDVIVEPSVWRWSIGDHDAEEVWVFRLD